jgi:uncharacterized protein (TIGR03435 family)
MMCRLVLAAMLSATALIGQTAPAFSVASVKRNPSAGNGIGNKFGPDTLRYTNAPLSVLIEAVYRLKHYQLVNLPGWAQSERWDIDAKSDGPVTRQALMEMLGALLADRFQLRFHRETREMPVYRLTVAKGGPKFGPAKPQGPDHRWGTRVATGLLDMAGTDMSNLTFFLSSQLDQPVEDQTGLTGIYDLKLEWAEDAMTKPSVDSLPSNAELPIASAVELELGLKMTVVKGPVEVLVIERAERAAGN